MDDRHPRSGGRGRCRQGILCAALLLATASAAPGSAWAQSGPAEDASHPPVSLDALLRLPRATPPPSEPPTQGGATRKEWLARFEQARGDVTAARGRLESAQAKLAELASGSESWQVSAPGAAPGAAETGPLSYSLRQEIRRSREDLGQAEKALDELRIEANLAGVPADWMEEPAVPAPSGSRANGS